MRAFAKVFFLVLEFFLLKGTFLLKVFLKVIFRESRTEAAWRGWEFALEMEFGFGW
eukprot:CAMPEP_0184672266 /NCGR_PEP_ID=MMETSP0308-20130426/85998_1 /TAXON_ID=38269 /ORGANISM="Gloeochaete witrockiana, Strain SAG 46.84" /LENGTH=55 /DNA_ID=CAMNT_0027119561 /DNA_START=958 /DNA_END=1122 /DNA_ORIENTATION=+